MAGPAPAQFTFTPEAVATMRSQIESREDPSERGFITAMAGFDLLEAQGAPPSGSSQRSPYLNALYDQVMSQLREEGLIADAGAGGRSIWVREPLSLRVGREAQEEAARPRTQQQLVSRGVQGGVESAVYRGFSGLSLSDVSGSVNVKAAVGPDGHFGTVTVTLGRDFTVGGIHPIGSEAAAIQEAVADRLAHASPDDMARVGFEPGNAFFTRYVIVPGE